jgi:2,3-diaminopropionate biosynthesis protein SbnB
MRDGDLLILKGDDVRALLAGREAELIDIVRAAYEAHAAGDSSLPHSTFLCFPEDRKSRIIALPAYLGQDFDVAGIKWIASFPSNLERQLERASAVVVLNSPKTGRPEALIEGSLISAKRTAASAALAAQRLQNGRRAASASLVGCGLINFEIARFLLTACPEIEKFFVYDLDAARAEQFAAKCRQLSPGLACEVVGDRPTAFSRSSLISLATTAVEPHIHDLSDCRPGSVILHISLRDLAPELILACDNVVDDVEHVCRAQTSVHLAEQLAGNRDFIRATLADVLTGRAPARSPSKDITVFSPFGVGVLDIAVAGRLRDYGLSRNCGTVISSFLPDAWVERE